MSFKKRYLIILILLLVIGCNTKPKPIFTPVTKQSVVDINDFIPQYHNIDLNDASNNAVLASFVGDYAKSIQYATDATYSFNIDNHSSIDSTMIANAIERFMGLVESKNSSKEDSTYAAKSLELLHRPRDLVTIFNQWKPYDAVDYISKEAKEYHFTLINEAHYSAINRVFTTQLLQPLWDNGYRYLALETLYYTDPYIADRGYPNNQTGYYTRESSFGNMVREALKIGYQLIPYETNDFSRSGTERDYHQANNLYNSTLKKDTIGKVLVHVGYGHLIENGDDNYSPMGEQLKRLSHMDIFTIDQETMLPLADIEKEHTYLQYIHKNR